MRNVEQTIRLLLWDWTGVDLGNFSLDTPLDDPLFSMDSLDTIEFIMNIEDHFLIEIDGYQLANIVTVGDLVKLVERLT